MNFNLCEALATWEWRIVLHLFKVYPFNMHVLCLYYSLQLICYLMSCLLSAKQYHGSYKEFIKALPNGWAWMNMLGVGLIKECFYRYSASKTRLLSF